MTVFEDYIQAGMDIQDWRQAGLPRAREERLRQGAQTRRAVVEAAKKLHVEERALVRNDFATAKRILALNVPELQKGHGCQIGVDAITRHIRAARKQGDL